jgi:cell division protein FtsN
MTSQRGGFVLGLVIGLLVGLALALGVAVYITKAPVPFVDKVQHRTAEQDTAETERNKTWDPNAPLGGKGASRPGTGAAPAPAAVAAASAAASASAPGTRAEAGAAARPARDPAAILAGAAPPAPGDGSVFFVQAGAYTRTDEAEQQRARLAIIGYTAKITEREQSGRTVYRVRVGPYDTREEAEGTQTRLTEASIEARLVRVEQKP